MKRNRLRHLPLLLIAAAFAGWFLTFAPTTVGGPASYIWVSGISMEPTLMSGDVVILRRSDTYRTGDVVAYRVPGGDPGAGRLIIHRIIGGSATDGFVMQGDNKPVPDPWQPNSSDIVGVQWLAFSGGGKYLNLLRSPAVVASLAAGLVVFTIMVAGGGGKDPSGPRPTVSGWMRWLKPGRRPAVASSESQVGD